MDPDLADFQRLALLIQRILDSDALCDRDGITLLTETESGCRSLEVGDMGAARWHIEQVVRCTEDLLHNGSLAATDGGPILETVHRILTEDVV